MSNLHETGSGDEWLDQSMALAQQFGSALHEFGTRNPWPDLPFLPRVMTHLITELWDHGFSQTEIREAFEAALAELPRYAAGEEVRS